jgi:hypothetical protein
LPEPVQRYLFSSEFNERIGRLCKVHEKLEGAAEKVRQAWIVFQEKAMADEIGFCGAKFETSAISGLQNRMTIALAERNGLATWIEYCHG